MFDTIFTLSYKVRQLSQVFLLVDEGTIRKYKSDLTEEIEPQINELLLRAEKGLRLLMKQESMLRTRVSLSCCLFIIHVD